MIVTPDVDEIVEGVAKPKHEKRHRVRAEAHRRIPLLHPGIGARCDPDPLGHHRGREPTLSPGDPEIAPEFPERSAETRGNLVMHAGSHKTPMDESLTMTCDHISEFIAGLLWGDDPGKSFSTDRPAAPRRDHGRVMSGLAAIA